MTVAESPCPILKEHVWETVGDRPWALVMQEKGLASGELGTHVGVLALGARGRKRPPGLFGLQKKVRKVGLNGSGP